jgi:3-keto-5-aminohexanoate cleavage enzyme
VGSLPPDANWGAAGIGKFQLKMNLAGMLMGGHVRVGLEDNIYFDDHNGELATNVMLIERIVRMASEMGRVIATPTEARQMLGFAPNGFAQFVKSAESLHSTVRAR